MTIFLSTSCQEKNGTAFDQKFYLSYSISGLGCNSGSKEPVIRIEGIKLLYAIEQTSSYWGQNLSKEKDTIIFTKISETSIDSIKELLKGYGDTTIFKYNECIISSGADYHLEVSYDKDTTFFVLVNTFDTTALKILNIVNPYLPPNRRLSGYEQLIRDEENCWMTQTRGHN